MHECVCVYVCVYTRGSVECQVAEVAPFDDLDREAAGGGVVGQTEQQLRNSTMRKRLSEVSLTYTRLGLQGLQKKTQRCVYSVSSGYGIRLHTQQSDGQILFY